MSLQPLATFSIKPEEETDTALLYGESEGWGSIGSATLDTAKEGKSKRMKVKRANTAKGRRVRRSLFKKLRVKKKWTPAVSLSHDVSNEKRDKSGKWTRADNNVDIDKSIPMEQLKSIAGWVKHLIKKSGPEDLWYDNKAFISQLWKRGEPKLSKFGVPTLKRFKELLVAANNEGLLTLGRGDMVGDMDPQKVRESETNLGPLKGVLKEPTAQFHFVVFDPKTMSLAISYDDSLIPAQPKAALSIEIGATNDLPKKVNVVADWDDMKSVIVGRSENDVLPAWYPSFTDPDGNEVDGPETAGETKAQYDPEMEKKCIKQQDALCKLLEKEGVQVFRPQLLSPEVAQEDPVGLSQAWMREIFMVFGNKIVVGQMRTPHRNKDIRAIEPLLQSIEQAGLATVHRLPACTFERNEDWANDTRSFLEGGDTFRLGKDVLVTMSYLASSGAGYRWLSDLLTPDGIDVWPAYMTQDWEHGDYVFSPIREGLCIAHLPAFVDGLLPSPCTDWDVVSITRDEANNKFAANGVVLRYNLVLLPSGNPRVVRALEKKGVDVIEIPYDGPMFWQGGIDCSISELWRQP
jgi:N-dimethylarginine dimethylaminohydrolase